MQILKRVKSTVMENQSEKGRLFSERCKRKGLKWAKIARELGVSPQNITHWRQRGVSAEYANAVAALLGCHPSEISIAKPATVIADQGLMAVGEPIRDYTIPTGLVPLISSVQAGSWCEAVDNFQPGDAEEWVPAPAKHGRHTYALRVTGTSMEPRFREGEIIVVDPEIAADSGKFVVAKKTGTQEVTLKQLIREGGESYLKALNQHWPEPILRMTEDWHICGVVICKLEMF